MREREREKDWAVLRLTLQDGEPGGEGAKVIQSHITFPQDFEVGRTPAIRLLTVANETVMRRTYSYWSVTE